MNFRKTLSALVSVIADEAEKNEPFRANIERVLGWGDLSQVRAQEKALKRGGRRTPAILDPVELADQGERVLRARLDTLSLDQLRDIVAQYGMDPGKLVMKWKDVGRTRDRIVELALVRATKGDAFRGD